MEPVAQKIDYSKRHRYVVPLGKMQVIGVDKGIAEKRVTVDLGNSIKGVFVCPSGADVQLGEYLTFYTEVLINAEPTPTSIQ